MIVSRGMVDARGSLSAASASVRATAAVLASAGSVISLPYSNRTLLTNTNSARSTMLKTGASDDDEPEYETLPHLEDLPDADLVPAGQDDSVHSGLYECLRLKPDSPFAREVLLLTSSLGDETRL